MNKTILVKDGRAGTASLEIKQGITEPSIEQWELDEAITRAEVAESDLKKANDRIRELEDEAGEGVEYPYSITTPAGGTIGYMFDGNKCSLQDIQIMEAIQSAYARLGGNQLLAALEAMGG